MRPEWDPDSLTADVQRCLREYPGVIVRSVTARYNCVGMTFASRRTWVDTDHIPTFLKDDDFKLLAGPSEAHIGDVVLYKTTEGEILHVGIIASRTENLHTGEITLKVLSKWGPWAEFVHDPAQVYASWGAPHEYWTDRKASP